MRNSNFDTKISIVALFAASLSAAFTPEAKAQEQSPPTPYLAALTTAATHAPVAQATGPELYELALALHALGDEGGSIHAMKAAANAGHPKAQRRMGELYDTDTAYVRRDYKWSIRWYQRARAGRNHPDAAAAKLRPVGEPEISSRRIAFLRRASDSPPPAQ